jgi:hypothetical protein
MPAAWTASPDHSGFNPNLAFPHMPLPRTTSASCSPVYSPAYASTSAPSLLRRESITFSPSCRQWRRWIWDRWTRR